MHASLESMVRYSAWLACAAVVGMTIFVATGIGQDPLQFLHPSDEYLRVLLRAGPASGGHTLPVSGGCRRFNHSSSCFNTCTRPWRATACVPSRPASTATIPSRSRRSTRSQGENPWELISNLVWLSGDPVPLFNELLVDSASSPLWYAALVVEFGQRSQAHRSPASSMSVVGDWLLEQPKRELLEHAFFEAEAEHAQRLYSTALQVLDWF